MEENLNRLSESVMSTSAASTHEIKEAITPLLKEEVAEAVKKEANVKLLPSVKSTWNAIQAQKVWEHEHSLLVFGLQGTNPPFEIAVDFLKKT